MSHINLCMSFIFLIQMAMAELSSFGIQTSSNSALSAYDPVVLTLWWETSVLRCTVYPYYASNWFMCYGWESLNVPCSHSSNIEFVDYKMMIEHNGSDSLSIDSVIVQFDEYYYAIQQWDMPDWDGDGYYTKTEQLCIDNNQCAPSKQMSYFDINLPNDYSHNAIWEDASSVYPDAICDTNVPTAVPTSSPTPKPTPRPSLRGDWTLYPTTDVPTTESPMEEGPNTNEETSGEGGAGSDGEYTDSLDLSPDAHARPTSPYHDQQVRTTVITDSVGIPPARKPNSETAEDHKAWDMRIIIFCGGALLLVAMMIFMVMFCRYRMCPKDHRMTSTLSIRKSYSTKKSKTKGSDTERGTVVTPGLQSLQTVHSMESLKSLRSLHRVHQSDQTCTGRVSVEDLTYSTDIHPVHRVGEVSVYNGSDRGLSGTISVEMEYIKNPQHIQSVQSVQCDNSQTKGYETHDQSEEIHMDLGDDIDVEYIGDLVDTVDSLDGRMRRMETPETMETETPIGIREDEFLIIAQSVAQSSQHLERECVLSLIGSEGISASMQVTPYHSDSDGVDSRELGLQYGRKAVLL